MNLSDALDAYYVRPWRWGEADCCTAACNVFAALHGVDPMARLRGRYANRAEAMAIIEEAGGLGRLGQRLATEAGLNARLLPAGAAPGDVALLQTPDGFALGTSLGAGRFAGKTLGGLVLTRAACMSWGLT